MSTLVVLAVLVLPVAYALLRAGVLGREDYLSYPGGASLAQMVGSIVCGNVGIGTFVALVLFTAAAPVLGYAIALAYTAGLLLCAALAGPIHRAARATGSHGLVDYLIRAHGVRQPLAIWLPVAVAFGLRTILQLLALALILQVAFGLAPGPALLLGAAVTAAYTAIGGYRVATETDLPQAAILLAGMGLAVWAIWRDGGGLPPEAPPFWSFGGWNPVLLVGVALFLPASALLGIDNWQRIATARSPGRARAAFVLAALICGAIYLMLCHVGRVAGTAGSADMAEVIATFRALMPGGMGWVADATIMVAVMSSMDTYVMPLMSALARTDWALWRVRAGVIALFAVLTGVAWAMGDVLVGVIAAFNVLVVFLPAVSGALVWGDRAGRAAAWSMGLGVAATLATTALAADQAAFAGFAVALGAYLALRPRRAE
jgi:Na+/proline symporter